MEDLERAIKKLVEKENLYRGKIFCENKIFIIFDGEIDVIDVDEMIWYKISKIDNMESYRWYLKYMNGKYREYAVERISEIIKVELKEKENVFLSCRSVEDFLNYYLKYGEKRKEVIKHIGAERLNDLLSEFARKGDLNCVKSLILLGADVNARDNDKWTPLWKACDEGHLNIVKYLISKGAIWDEAVKDYGFPVSQAAAKGHIDVVKYFIEELYFDVSKKDREGWTLLHCGARYGHLEVVKYFISKDLDVNARDKHNETPLWKACIGGYLNIVKYLISKGAIWDEAVKDHGFPVSQAASKGHLGIVKYFVEELHFDVNKEDKDGWTLLHWGARFNQPEVVRYLISVSADVNAKDNKGRTPMDVANSDEIKEYLKRHR